MASFPYARTVLVDKEVNLSVHMEFCFYKSVVSISQKYLPGSVLVLRELHHMVDQVFQLEVWDAIVSEVLKQATSACDFL